MFAWCFKISHVNAYILYCLTRNVGESTTHLIKFKQTLIKELVNQANKIIPGDHKQHVTKKPTGNMTFSKQPSHTVCWVPNDHICVECRGQDNHKKNKACL